jgi:methionyl-tRNA formyltransferase
MKILFLGTPQLAVPVLQQVAAEHTVVGVLTRPDQPVGRSKKPVPSPVATAADSLGLKVFKPAQLSPGILKILAELEADIFVTFAYGVILNENFFTITRHGGINVHPSLLPLYRGPSPIQSALYNGDSESGITIQTVKLAVDSGDILLQHPFPIALNDTVVTLEELVSSKAPEMVIEVLEMFENGTVNPVEQDSEQATRCRLIKKEQSVIDWSRSALEIHNMVRAFCKWPVAMTMLEDIRYSIFSSHPLEQEGEVHFPGTILEATPKKGLIVQCGDGMLLLNEIQVSGKKRMQAKSFLNGQRDLAGRRFES